MPSAGWHDSNDSGSGDLRHAVYRQFQLALDHFINFFLRMKMFVNGCPAHEFIMREGHVGRVKIAPMPAWQALNHAEAADIHKRHKFVILRSEGPALTGHRSHSHSNRRPSD